MLTRGQFLEYLRDALNHLYDPDHLCHSPLAGLFGVAKRHDTFAALQQILIEAVASLEPKAGTPSQLRAWRIYELLFYRYVQQHTVQTVAEQLGVTVRHLRREQRAALEALAYQLWQQFDLEAKLGGQGEAQTGPQLLEAGPTVSDELAWLREAPPEKPTDLKQALATVLETVQPLATQYRVRLDVTTADVIPALAVHEVALDQSLLNLLTVAIPRSACGGIRVKARPLGREVEIEVRCTRTPSGHPPGPADAASLDMARQLVDLCGGRLSIEDDGRAFRATLAIPALQQLSVLVIDDNADTLQLLERYTAGTRYRLIGTRDPEQAASLTEKLLPRLIVLDVMMPRVDGWRVLAQLRQHPLLSHTPIIVCTILPQEDLALSLGASGFVRKPVTQQAFLAALDLVVEGMERGPR